MNGIDLKAGNDTLLSHNYLQDLSELSGLQILGYFVTRDPVAVALSGKTGG